MNLRDQLTRFLSPLSNRIRMMVARAVISTVNDDTKVQQMCIKLLAGEMRDKVEHLQGYGFTSVPLPDMEAGVVFIAGDRGNPMILAVGDRLYRLKGLKGGEVALYTDEGDKIHLKRDRNIQISTKILTVDAEDEVNYTTTNIKADASGNCTITVNGSTKLICSDVEIGENTLQAVIQSERFKAYFDTHVHTGNLGAPTSPPQVPMPQSVFSTEVKTGG